MNTELLMPESAAAAPWRRMFTSLRGAEHSAGVHTKRLAEYFADKGRHDLAATYERFSVEEYSHERAVAALCEHADPLDDATASVYSGGRLRVRGDDWFVEVLGLIHLVFEPAAMAFFTYLLSVSSQTFAAPWRDAIHEKLEPILREEAGHISVGKRLFTAALERTSPDVACEVVRSLRLHRSFITLGMRSFFSERSEDAATCAAMLRRYDDVLAHVNRTRRAS